MELLYVTQVAPYKDGPAGAHGVLEQSATAMAELAESAGLTFTHVRDVRTLPASPAPRVLALFTIGETPWSASQQKSLLAALDSGAMSVLGLHAATDSCYGWDDFGSLVGARFNGHPWTQDFTVEVCDRTHPATAHLDATFQWHDEVYLFRDLRPDAHVLLRVDETCLDMSRPGATRPEHGFPLSWCFTHGAGRAFYSALGHFPGAYESPQNLRVMQGGLEWVLAS